MIVEHLVKMVSRSDSGQKEK